MLQFLDSMKLQCMINKGENRDNVDLWWRRELISIQCPVENGKYDGLVGILRDRGGEREGGERTTNLSGEWDHIAYCNRVFFYFIDQRQNETRRDIVTKLISTLR